MIYSWTKIFFKIMYSTYIFILIFAYFAWDIHMTIQQNDMASGWKFLMQGSNPLIKDSEGWNSFLILYQIISFTGFAIIFYIIHKRFIEGNESKVDELDEDEIIVPPYPYDEDKLQLIIGLKHNKLNLKKVKKPKWIIIDEKGLYQNILITGTIGTGKTAAAMYSFAKQIMFMKSYDPYMKPGMLILDVKGNFYAQVLEFAKEVNRLDDIIIIELNGKYKYNPMHKLDLKPLVLANRIKTILGMFSPKGATDGYWLDKAELLIAECIKLCRLYNDNYVSFDEINKLVNNKSYLVNKITILVEDQDIMTQEELELFDTARDYFEHEYINLAEQTLSIIQSVVTQMTQFFYTDPDVKRTFCAPVEELNFLGFKDVVDRGKIVILKMNVAQYRNLAKTIAAYMKLDFQTEVMSRLIRPGANKNRPVFMISDEYQEFVTSTDAEFYAQSREPKCVSIVATQSYTSLINTLKDRDIVRTVTQNLINKIWLRTDDSFTVEEAQKQLGKEDKEKASRSISESSGDVKRSGILGSLTSDKASISESININVQKEFTFDESILTQHLDVFTGVCFLSDGYKIIEPTIVHLQPYFSDTIKKAIKSKRKIVTEENISKKEKISNKPKEVIDIKEKVTFDEEVLQNNLQSVNTDVNMNYQNQDSILQDDNLAYQDQDLLLQDNTAYQDSTYNDNVENKSLINYTEDISNNKLVEKSTRKRYYIKKKGGRLLKR